MKTKCAGLRKHRPKKKFRFEYIKGKFSGMNKERREIRLFSELEDDESWHKWIRKSLEDYWKDKR